MKKVGLMLLCVMTMPAAAFSVDLGPPPSVNAGADQIVNIQTLQNATVSGAVLMSWTQQSGPAGGNLTFGSPQLEDTTISADVEGVYVARLTATTLLLNSAFDEITFVWDVSPPQITPPQDILVEAANSGGAIVTYPPPTISDATATTYSISYASGSQFSLGTTTLVIVATDAAGNSATSSFHITVRDSTPPSIHGDIVVEADSPNGTVVQFAAATDTVDPAPLVSASPPSDSQFPVGLNTVSVSAIDASGNAVSGSFLVVVRDTIPPVLNPPADITVQAENANGAAVSFLPAMAEDLVSQVSIKYSHDSGTIFPVGRTHVLVTAMDAAGNSTSATFLVSVTDPNAPIISSPLSITPNPATAADPVTLSASFGTSSLNWNWDFGDGTTSTSQGVVIHIYSAPGVYTVTLRVTDSLQRTTVQTTPLSVTTVSLGGGGSPGEPPQQLLDIKLSGKVKAFAPDKSQFALKCRLPKIPGDLQLSGANLSVNVGGALVNISLDVKGRGKNASGSASVKLNKTGDAVLQIKAIGSFQESWRMGGLDLAIETSKGELQFFVFVSLNNNLYSVEVPTSTKVVHSKTGQFKNL